MSDGLRLARAFYEACVAPVLAGVPHAAGLIGPGSEVLGFDDVRSTDHDWGPRALIFVGDDTSAADLARLDDALDRALPAQFGSHPVRFALAHDREVRHRVQVLRRGEWFRAQLGFDPLQPIRPEHWAAVPSWRLGEVVSGAVFRDDDGALSRARDALGWYPDDVWRWVLAAQWQRIAEDEAFPGRCAEVGDLLGAAIEVARIARDVMRLWLFMARTYPPYAKWLGSAFSATPGTLGVLSDLRAAVAAPHWRAQEQHLTAALVATARRQNELRLCADPEPTLRPYFDRPYLVVGADRFAAALRHAIADPELRRFPLTGVVDQFVDSTDALGSAQLRSAFAAALLAEPS